MAPGELKILAWVVTDLQKKNGLNPKILIFSTLLKFVFFEKATKFDEISILLLTNKFVFFVSRYSFEHQSGSQT